MSALPPKADMLSVGIDVCFCANSGHWVRTDDTFLVALPGKKGSRHWTDKHYLLAAVAYSGNQRCMPRSR